MHFKTAQFFGRVLNFRASVKKMKNCCEIYKEGVCFPFFCPLYMWEETDKLSEKLKNGKDDRLTVPNTPDGLRVMSCNVWAD